VRGYAENTVFMPLRVQASCQPPNSTLWTISHTQEEMEVIAMERNVKGL
jgi:hypothetical protein